MTKQPQRYRDLVALCLFSAVAVVIAGCGDSGPTTYQVSGTVKFSDGTPAANASINFEQQSGKPVSAYGVVGADGTYKVQLDEKSEGAPAGDYKVTVTGDGVSPEFNDSSTTPLTATVTKEGPNKFDFAVEKAK